MSAKLLGCSPEIILFLLLARPHLNAEQQQSVGSLVADINDWEGFFSWVSEHRLQALVAKNILLYAQPNLTKEQVNRLKEYQQYAVRQHLKQRVVLRDVLIWFEQARLSITGFKSSRLADVLYGHAYLRQSRDLDFLVPKKDWLLAVKLLLDKGYVVVHESSQFTIIQDDVIDAWLAVTDQILFMSPQGVLVELHHRLSRWHCEFSVNDVWIWQDLSVQKTHELSLLSLEKLFIYSCYHGTKHYWFRYHWLLDVSLMLQQPNIDWTWIVKESKRLGVERFIAISVQLIEQLGQFKVPEELRCRIKHVAIPQQSIMLKYLTSYPLYSPELRQKNTSTMVYWLNGYGFRSRLQSHWSAKMCVWTSFLRPTLAETLPNSGAGSLHWFTLLMNRFVRIWKKYIGSSAHKKD